MQKNSIIYAWEGSNYASLAVSFSCIVNKITWRYRSSHSQMFFKIGVLKNFANYNGKKLCWSLFLIKLQTLRPVALFKIDSNTIVFLWNWQKVLRTPSSTEHLQWLFFKISNSNNLFKDFSVIISYPQQISDHLQLS